MMKKSLSRGRIYLAVGSGGVAVAVILRLIACFSLRKPSGHFEGPLALVSGGILLITLLFLLTYGLGGKERQSRGTDAFSPYIYIPVGCYCAAILFCGVLLLSGSSFADAGRAARIIRCAAAVFLIVTAGYCVFTVAGTKRRSVIRGAFSLSGALGNLLLALYLFLNTTFAMNDPIKVSEEVAFLFAAIFFVTESRDALGRGHSRTQITVALIASALSLYASLPTLIYRLFAGEMISTDPLFPILLLVTGLLTGAKGCYLQTGERKKTVHPFVRNLTAAADEREYETALAAEEARSAAQSAESTDEAQEAAEEKPQATEEKEAPAGEREEEA